MEQIDLLIQRFWQGNASQEEITLLMELLIKFEPLLTDAGREVFVELSKQGRSAVNQEKMQLMLYQIHEHIEPVKMVAIPARLVGFRGRVIWWAAAVIFMLAAGTAIFLQRPGSHSQTAQQVRLQINGLVKTVANRTDTIQTLELNDGSVVSLHPHSKLLYQEPFEPSSRLLQLDGKAMFQVITDPSRPFKVIAGNIVTTALGTRFTVNATSPAFISVLLHEGKVMINAKDSMRSSMKGVVVLMPGELFSFNTSGNDYMVTTDKGNKPETNTAAADIDSNNKARTRQISFSNEALGIVLHQLSAIYKTELRFAAADVDGLYFTGDIRKTDSLKTVLTAICNMNPLVFKQKDNYIQITKSN